MSRIIVGVGEIQASAGPDAILRALGLGSCVAVMAHDPGVRCAGLAHVALPDSSIDAERAQQQPGYFADTALPALFKCMREAGAGPDPKKYIIKLVGGASVMDPTGHFNIGKRNLLALRKGLWQLGLGPLGEDVGGNKSRSVEMLAKTGYVTVNYTHQAARIF
jgi:chemotaxis protein CheD